jgi:photosystem II stability/assembly factor-like uncharacterized protein
MLALLAIIPACKDNDDPVNANNEASWVSVSLPNSIYQTPNTLYNIYFPASGMLYVASYNHLFSSSDGGTTWSDSHYPTNIDGSGDSLSGPLGVSPNGTLFTVISVTPGLNGPSSTESKLYRSIDAGASWQEIQAPAGNGNDPYLGLPAFNTNGTAYITAHGNLYASADNGATWSLILSTNISGNGEPTINVAPNGTLYACITNSGLLRSTNGGTTWDTVNAGLPSFTAALITEPNIVGISPSGTIYSEIYIQHAAGNSYVNTLYYSNDGGTTWQEAGDGIANNANVSSMLFLKNNSVIATTAFGDFVSTDGINWMVYDINKPGNNAGLLGIDAQQYLYAENYLGALFKTAKPLD